MSEEPYIKGLSLDDYRELIGIYAEAINALKAKEAEQIKTKDAFLNMLEDLYEVHEKLKSLFDKFILAMVNALDAKSHWTRGHSERVANYARRIAQTMGFNGNGLKRLHLAGLLHDIGKIGTYDYLLDKPEKLNDKEFEIVKRHPVEAVRILKHIDEFSDILPIIRHHHERIDGKGYPDGLKGDEIPMGARILHVADSFDSMTSDRPYRPAPGKEYAISEFIKHRGTQFDPQVVDAFLKILKKEPVLDQN
jgi:putative nucleotidyltransferase with HDIG domain